MRYTEPIKGAVAMPEFDQPLFPTCCNCGSADIVFIIVDGRENYCEPCMDKISDHFDNLHESEWPVNGCQRCDIELTESECWIEWEN